MPQPYWFIIEMTGFSITVISVLYFILGTIEKRHLCTVDQFAEEVDELEMDETQLIPIPVAPAEVWESLSEEDRYYFSSGRWAKAR